MTITNTVSEALSRVGFNSSLWVPEHEPYANIITQQRFPLIALYGNEDISPHAKFDRSNIVKIPGLIKSSPSDSFNPKIDQYLNYPTEFVTTAAQTGWVAGTAQNITLASTGGLGPNDIIRAKSTGAEYAIVSITSSVIVSAKPAAGGAAGDGTDNLADGEIMEAAGSAWIDGATVTDGLQASPAQNSNYMQTHINPYGMGWLEKTVKKFPGQTNQLDTSRTLARINHNQKRELRALFGAKKDNTTVSASSYHLYLAAGLLGLSNREVNAGGSITLDEWNQYIMPDITQFGGGDFHAMCGGSVLGTWSALAADYIRTNQSDKVYGNKVMRIQTSVEEIVLHGTEPMNNRPGEMLMFQPSLLERKYNPTFNGVHFSDMGARDQIKDINMYMTTECMIPRNEDVISTVKGVVA